MLDYTKTIDLTKFLRLLETIQKGEEFIEIRLGSDSIGGINLRMQGTTVHCNIAGVPAFSFVIPRLANDDVNLADRLNEAIELLKKQLQDETKTLATKP